MIRCLEKGSAVPLQGAARSRLRPASAGRRPAHGSRAPYTYVTTKEFLLQFGFDLPDIEKLEDSGLLS